MKFFKLNLVTKKFSLKMSYLTNERIIAFKRARSRPSLDIKIMDLQTFVVNNRSINLAIFRF